MTERPEAEIFYTVDDIAEHLWVSKRQVHRWIEQELLVAHWFGRSVRVSDADLKAFLAARRGGHHDLAA
jgi:excisionase family DNA binding protein